jgi:hypothetical protein
VNAAIPPAIDRFLPTWDVHEVHSVELPISATEALRLVRELRFGSDPLVRALLRIRGVGSGGTVVDAFHRLGFELLVDEPTQLVVGASGRPWSPRSRIGRLGDAGPGTVRVAADFRAEPTALGSRLTTETRIAAVDDAARRSFGRYWRVVGRFSALIRRRWLRAVRDAARERPQFPTTGLDGRDDRP